MKTVHADLILANRSGEYQRNVASQAARRGHFHKKRLHGEGSIHYGPVEVRPRTINLADVPSATSIDAPKGMHRTFTDR